MIINYKFKVLKGDLGFLFSRNTDHNVQNEYVRELRKLLAFVINLYLYMHITLE